MKIIILGGGIAGLTTAIALQKKGIEVRIFEKVNQLEKVGAGIILAINAMKILDHLGLSNALQKKGYILNGMLITKPDLSPLNTNVLPYFIEKYGYPCVAIHRSDLQQTLYDTLTPDTLNTNKECINLLEADNQVKLSFRDGSHEFADMVIGADGIHSISRQNISDKILTSFAGHTCWRGVAPVTENLNHDWSCLNEAWGIGKRFGFTRINTREVYWYALSNCLAGEQDDKSQLSDKLLEMFEDFSETILKIIRATSAETIIRQDIYDIRPMNSWHKGRICVLGDSAHAITPNLGQGACQAIEDAYCIADLIYIGLQENEKPEKIFEKFYAKRSARVRFIRETSLTIGKMGQLENRFLVKLRNVLLKNTSIKTNRKRFAKVFDM